MTQNPTDQNICKACNQTFNSDRELQEHQRDSHSGGNKGESVQDQDGRDQGEIRRERIA